MVSADRLVIEKLNRLIDDNLNNPAFSVDVICQMLGVSRSQLHRIVKEQKQLSTSLYIRRYRLEKAGNLLLDTDLRISEISDLIGIQNPQNFSTYFIEEYKVSPTEYRKQYQKTPQPAGSPPPQPAANPAIGAEAVLPPIPVSTKKKQWRPVIMAVLLLLLIGFSLYRWFFRPSANTPDTSERSIAMLPFIRLGMANDDPTSEAIMNEIHTSLLGFRNLKVISRSSSEKYLDTQKSIWQIGDELRVATVLRGSVLKTADQLQVKVEIMDTREDIRLWAHTYQSAYKDLFTLTEQIVRDVIRELNLTNSPSASEKLAHIRTHNLSAYNLFVQGKQLLVSRLEPDLMEARNRFDQALRLDSTFAEAYAQKAIACHLLIGSAKIDNPTLNRLTEENALKAIQFDPGNSSAYAVLGSLYYSTYQWQASANAYRIALQYNPNDAQTCHWFSLLMRTTGQLDEAVRYSTRAIALDPLHPVMMSAYISNCALSGRFGSARTGIEAGRGLFDKSFAFQLGIAYYWLAREEYTSAAACFRQMMVLNPDDRGQIPLLLYCEARRGDRQKAIQFLRGLTTATPRADYERAVVYAGLNQADSSLYYLTKAAGGGYFYRDTKVMPPFRQYHNNPVFKAVLRRFNLPEN